MIGGAAVADKVKKLKWLRSRMLATEAGSLAYRIVFCD